MRRVVNAFVWFVLHAGLGVLVVYATIETVVAWTCRRQPVRPYAPTGNGPWTSAPRAVPDHPWPLHRTPAHQGPFPPNRGTDPWGAGDMRLDRPTWWPGEHP